MKEKKETPFDVNADIDPVTRVGWVIESLERLRQQYIDIDCDSVALCIKLLQGYADRFESNKEEQTDIDAVIMLLNKVSTDLDVIRDIVIQDTGDLDKSILDAGKQEDKE